MKLSNILLTSTLTFGILSIFASNYAIKKEFDKVDKSDPYWNYIEFANQPFKHLNIVGGNVSTIIYEESSNTSVKVLKSWRGSHDGSIKCQVRNDTLFVDFSNHLQSTGEKYWMNNTVALRILNPGIQSIIASESRINLDKLTRNSLHIELSGKSVLRVNSYRRVLDSIDINQKDSSLAVFAMSRDIDGPTGMQLTHLTAKLEGTSILDMKHSNIKQLSLKVGDTSAILLTGSTLDVLSGKK